MFEMKELDFTRLTECIGLTILIKIEQKKYLKKINNFIPARLYNIIPLLQ